MIDEDSKIVNLGQKFVYIKEGLSREFLMVSSMKLVVFLACIWFSCIEYFV